MYTHIHWEGENHSGPIQKSSGVELPTSQWSKHRFARRPIFEVWLALGPRGWICPTPHRLLHFNVSGGANSSESRNILLVMWLLTVLTMNMQWVHAGSQNQYFKRKRQILNIYGQIKFNGVILTVTTKSFKKNNLQAKCLYSCTCLSSFNTRS